MSKHTKGPWTQNGSKVRNANRCIVADVRDLDHANPATAHAALANARLIAAAPEMLEALKDIVSLTENGWHGARRESLDGQRLLACLNRARSVIFKARGEP